VHLRQIVKYTNYKRFGSKSKIIFEGQEVKKDPNAPPNQQGPDQQPHPPQPPPEQNPK